MTAAPGPWADLPVNVWLVGQELPATQRGDRYTAASVLGHPGKMLPAIARRLITDYTRPGDWVLDPLSGIGTTGVEAVHLGRHYVGLELEPRFVAWQEENLARARADGATGRFAVIAADARRLAGDAPDAALPGPVAAVITSPPYGDRLGRLHRTNGISVHQLARFGRLNALRLEPGIYGTGQTNIGNLRGPAYLAAMRQVYAGCFEVLRPGGILAIVLQAQRDRHRYRPLHHDTARLCQELGFEFMDEIVAVLGRVALPKDEPARVVAHARFWRRLGIGHLRQEGFPVTLNQVEYALLLCKPDATARGRPRAPAAPTTTKAAARPLLRA